MAIGESETTGVALDRFVWSSEEDSSLTSFQKKVVRDSKVARMLEEMKLTLQTFHQDSSVSSLLGSSRSSGYSSLCEATLTPTPFTASTPHTLTHHHHKLSVDGSTASFNHNCTESSILRRKSYFKCFSLREHPVTDSASEDNSSILSDQSFCSSCDGELTEQCSHQTGEVMCSIQSSTDETHRCNQAELSTITEDGNSTTCEISTGPIQNEVDSEIHNTFEDTTLSGDHTQSSERTVIVIRELKRQSDTWSVPNAVMRSESVTQRLKESRRLAEIKQTIIEELLHEAWTQLSIQHQAKSALLQCQRRGQVEEIEAERLILLAGERYKTFQSEATQLVSQHLSESPVKDKIEPCTATLFLSDIRIQFAHNRPRLKESKMEHFVCLLRENKTQGITATQLVSCQTPPTKLEFNNRFTLPEIPHNFELILEVYRMISSSPLPRKRTFSHVINSARKLSIKKYKKPCLTCTTRPVSIVLECENGALKFEDALVSHFQFACRVVITRKMLSKTVYNIEDSGPAGIEGLEVMAFADPNIGSDFPTPHGYLSVFRGVWERKWFALHETKLSFWLYPDQPANRERPLGCFDLAQSQGLAESANTDTCAWKHSFCIPIATTTNKKVLLSAGGEQEMEEWVAAINQVIVSSSTWNP